MMFERRVFKNGAGRIAKLQGKNPPVLRARESAGSTRRFVLLTGLDSSAERFHVDRRIRPIDTRDKAWRRQHLFSIEPLLQIDDEKENVVDIVVEKEIFNVADLPVCRLDAISTNVLGAAELGIR
jgi:hypothetical protein